jgi:Predicted transcriptional regulator
MLDRMGGRIDVTTPGKRGSGGITPAERDILHFVLEHQPVTARQVADHMAEVRGTARTTVLTHLERLRRRRVLERAAGEDGVNVYRAARPPAELLTGLVRDFVDRILGGTASPLVAYLTQRADLTDDEIAALEAVIARNEARAKTDDESKGGGETP